MTKYVGAVVRSSFQLAIGAEQDRFESKSSGTKKVDLPGALKKYKTIFTSAMFLGRPLDSKGRTKKRVFSFDGS